MDHLLRGKAPISDAGWVDWSIGYLNHDHENITLYLESSFTAVVNTPEASIRFALPS